MSFLIPFLVPKTCDYWELHPLPVCRKIFKGFFFCPCVAIKFCVLQTPKLRVGMWGFALKVSVYKSISLWSISHHKCCVFLLLLFLAIVASLGGWKFFIALKSGNKFRFFLNLNLIVNTYNLHWLWCVLKPLVALHSLQYTNRHPYLSVIFV